MALYQTVVTAVIANRACLNGVAVVVQPPNVCDEEIAYLRETAQASYEQMSQAQGRLLESLRKVSMPPPGSGMADRHWRV